MKYFLTEDNRFIFYGATWRSYSYKSAEEAKAAAERLIAMGKN